MKKTVMTRVSQFLAQKSVARRQPTINAETILDASKLNPDITITAPMNELPKYPAGIVQHHFPPLIFVKPPSSGSTVIDSTFAPVSSPANACENSWRATVINLNGYSMSFKYAIFHNSTIATM
ncbi:hypothetical protein AX774_g2415 [Zancudomyces culisetae]|uniref:Uncharacterized protein n=1 Tax=Zancudomyces culisetae TaxID=1213189 RepID=A0A1R1PT20_ZANCU|nr:hypothetical protein AX774_g2415 [Zancudomyces culisetae]|eukprot:OMH84069.1 hypothetical protein AX774_g2415 [Zancudomyces culisetae]